ncbi:5eaa8292-5907-4a6c-8112-d3b3fa372711 [Thermothielavioides terrestris]|jgi:hypothetical protein|uniref:5eaa8292-5907-4a6c-8112-d3b3fa372711 n=1 Tax=Thermothielavioides terrestris TaxID=2587410 RepID=A0A3S4EVD9_9PEZI|nr:5eaa8292-5907-4a6c-8112-d3b3fa372711 [Thermothielavioides terrestris]
MAEQQQAPPPFGLVPAGQPLITVPTESPTPTSFLYAIPPAQAQPGAGAPSKSFSHLTVFLFPGVVLPPDTAAAIYLVTPPTGPGQPELNFKFLGGIGAGKESAVFKLNTPTTSPPSATTTGGGSQPGGASAAGSSSSSSNVVIGISIEPAASVAAQLAQLANTTSTSTSSSSATSASGGAASGALVPAGSRAQQQQPSTLVLAQRIIKNAFNFLAGFSGTAGEVEVVPLRAFEEWWRKFENRVRTDPGFLERDD